MQRRVQDQPRTVTSRTLRLEGVGAMPAPPKGRFKPSADRSQAERERRHRERAIAAWLRDLSR